MAELSLREQIANYLSRQFISQDISGLPKDECFTESNYLIDLMLAKVDKALLTDERMKVIEGEVFHESMSKNDGDGFETNVKRAIAKAQLQAIKDILEGK